MQSSPRLAFAASFSFEPLQRWLRFWMKELGLSAQFSFAGYAQLQHELRLPQVFRDAAACVGLLNFADWQRTLRDSTAFDAERFQSDFAMFLESVEIGLTTCQHLLLVVCPSRPSPHAGPERGVAFGAAAAQLQERATKESRLSVITAKELSTLYPVQEPFDVIADEIGHLPYSESMWCALGATCTRMLLPVLAPPLKAVIADCDYTLWHNAVGEVGASGIVCAPRHRELQERLLVLRKSGVLICLCSRNIEADVWEVLDSGETLLLREHITAASIDPHLRKSEGIQRLSEELQISPESFFFIDDNPAECHEVRSVFPQVAAWCMPQTHAEVKQQMPHVWRLDVRNGATADDLRRAETYKAQAERKTLLANCASRADFHRELQVKITFIGLTGAARDMHDRIIQMQQRTNQFNSWKRPPSPVSALLQCEGFVMNVADRYGDYGIVGCTICRREGEVLRVLSFMMSCRVLGRGAEHAMLAELAKLALTSPSCRTVAVGVVEAPRNQPVQRFLKEAASSVKGECICSAEKAQCSQRPVEDDSYDSWEDASPGYWWCFPVDALKDFAFDPNLDSQLGTMDEEASTDVKKEPTDSIQEPPHHDSQSALLNKVAAALTDIPIKLRTVQHAMQACGRDVLPFVGCHGNSPSEDETKNILRSLWRNVLQMPTPAEHELDLQDDVPFAACGGDSVLAVQFISLAARHGLRLPHNLNMEMLTIRQVFSIVKNADTKQDAKHKSHVANGTKTAGATESLRILERDSRTPKAELRVSGITACASGNLEDAQQLASSGGWHPAFAIDRHRNTALMWAAGCGHLHIVRWLLEDLGVSVDATNKDGRSALMWACKNGKLPVVTYLLAEGGANAMLRMKDDSTAFDWAVLGGDIPTMEHVASHPEVDLHALNKFGCSAVQWAAASGNVSSCRWLYSKGIDFSHVNQARHGAVNKAAWKGYADALTWLLVAEDGPHLTEQLFLLDHEGLTVAQLARMGGHCDVADWLQNLADELQPEHGKTFTDKEVMAKDKARCAAR